MVTSLWKDVSSSHFRLICTSTKSAATTVIWTKDGTILTIDGSPYLSYQVVTDRRTSTYNNVLTSVGDSSSDEGNYTCTVSNGFGSGSRDIRIGGLSTNMVIRPWIVGVPFLG